ncbi:MAG: SpoIIE family protein phosphatase [Sedimentisphaerales bacterium]|nr:SpoIIE family protein phosphatase [Sedimentisphaerales bacterium]
MAKSISIRRSLLKNLILIILLLSGAIMAIMIIRIQTAVRYLSQVIISQTIDQSESRLNRFFEPISENINIVKSWCENGAIDLDHPDSFRRYFTSFIEQHPHISSVIIADTLGNEYMLLQNHDQWLLRQRIQNHETTFRFSQWTNADTTPQSRPATERELQYNPNERPWFVGALKNIPASSDSANPDQTTSQIFWTEPYRFFTTNEPGITVSQAFRGPNGKQYVLAFDILLNEIQKFTEKIKVLDQGDVFIVSGKQIQDESKAHYLIGFSRNGRCGQCLDPQQVLLQPPQALHRIPLLRDADAAFSDITPKQFENSLPIVRFECDHLQWWGIAKPYQIEGSDFLWIFVMVPESDIISAIKEERIIVVLITLTILFFGVYRACTIAKRFSSPIESLVQQSNRISKGDLEPGPNIDSNVTEVRQLADAQEHMRRGLKSLMKLERDLQLAQQIQQNTLPTKIPSLPGFQIDAWNKPAEQTGGDTYDIIGLRTAHDNSEIDLTNDDPDQLLLLLADAAGHGIGPALSVAQLRSMLRMGAHIASGIDIIAKHINEQLCDDLPEGRFITAWLGLLDHRKNTLTSFSAGQGPLLLYRAEQKEFQTFSSDTLPLGVLDCLDIEVAEPITLAPGDIFAVISDGIFEAANPDSEQFKQKRVRNVIAQNAHLSATQIIEALRQAANNFTHNAPPDDDQTIIIIKKT